MSYDFDDYDELEAQEKAEKYGREASEKDIKNVRSKMNKMNHGPLAKMWDKITVLWDAFNSPNTPLSVKTLIIGGLIYMVSPIDLIPDVIPFLGLTDDAGVLALIYTRFKQLAASI